MKANMKRIVMSLVAIVMIVPATMAQSNQTIVERLDSKLGVKLPAEFNDKVLDFVKNNTTMSDSDLTAFTEDFIINEMKKDWGISKQNQLLFIWDKIYKSVSGNKLYNWLDDENTRGKEYRKTVKQSYTFYKAYEKDVIEYMNRRSAEYRKQSAEAKQRSAEAVRGIMKKDSLGLQEMAKFYSLYLKNPDIVRKDEINKSKKLINWVIPDCKKYNIDYRAILLKELGDKKKVDDVLKFYGVE